MFFHESNGLVDVNIVDGKYYVPKKRPLSFTLDRAGVYQLLNPQSFKKTDSTYILGLAGPLDQMSSSVGGLEPSSGPSLYATGGRPPFSKRYDYDAGTLVNQSVTGGQSEEETKEDILPETARVILEDEFDV